VLPVEVLRRPERQEKLRAARVFALYIRLTRGQDSLVIQAGDDNRRGQALALPQLDLRSFVLPVIAPDADETAAHETVLLELDKASGGKTVWRLVPGSAQA
jgi:DNA polymerase-3 subunit epsilon